VLFEGQLYTPNNLPPRYLPKLMALQFTVPLVVLSLIGLAIGLFMLYRNKFKLSKWLILYAWFIFPLVYIIGSNTVIYTNFRHFLFITPPLFIFAGLAIQQITSRLKKSTLILLFFLIIIIPGLFSIIQLHPYQYIYYNSFIGGVEGASQKYVLDYWNTSYKEAMDYVNENIPPGSKLLFWKEDLFGRVYAENNYLFSGHTVIPEKEYSNFDYVVLPTTQIGNHPFFSKYPVVYSVDVDHVSLMKVLKISNDRK
jgi:hypothetical protein